MAQNLLGNEVFTRQSYCIFLYFLGLPSCDRNLSCGVNADCFKINNTDTCVCDPGYRNTSNTCAGKCPVE